MSKPTTKVTKQMYQDVIDRDGCCKICSSHQWLQLHHIILRSAGGLNVPDNLITLCQRCHHDVVHKDTKKWTPILLDMNGVTDISKLKAKNKWEVLK